MQPTLLRHYARRFEKMLKAFTQTGSTLCRYFVFLTVLVPLSGRAQTLPSGVNNAPPTIIGDNESIWSDTTVNLLGNGNIGRNFEVGNPDGSSTNVELNVLGGELGSGDYYISTGFRSYAGSVVNISGGIVAVDNSFGGPSVTHRAFVAHTGSEVNILGGEVGAGAIVGNGAVVNISGGSVGLNASNFYPTAMSVGNGGLVNISSGEIGSHFFSAAGSNVEISGGRFNGHFYAGENSIVTVRGGIFDQHFRALSGSQLSLLGNEFQLNGVALSSGNVTLADSDVLSGTLQDGSVFIFSPLAGDTLVDVQLVSSAIPTFDTTPVVISNDAVTSGLRKGQYLSVVEGGVIGKDFAAVNAMIHVSGGSTDSGLELLETQLVATHGNMGSVSLYQGSQASLVGGFVSQFRATSGSVVDLSGASVGWFSLVEAGAELNVTGGSLGQRFNARIGSVVNISGGNIEQGFQASSGSEINLFGSELFLDGQLVSNLDYGETMLISARDISLEAKLIDGSELNFDLISSFSSGLDLFHPDATLTFTRVHAGDVIPNGIVDGSDYLAWQIGTSATTENLASWQTNYGQSVNATGATLAVPEPTSLVMSALVSATLLLRRRRL